MDFLTAAEDFIKTNYPEYMADFVDYYTKSRERYSVNLSVISALTTLRLYDQFLLDWESRALTNQD